MDQRDLQLIYTAMATDMSHVFKNDVEVAMKKCYVGLPNKKGSEKSPTVQLSLGSDTLY